MPQTAAQTTARKTTAARATRAPVGWGLPPLFSVTDGAASRAPAPQRSQRRPSARAQEPKLGTRDPLLASYIEALRDVPPFTPEQERHAAAELAELETKVWSELLQVPVAVAQLVQRSEALDRSLRARVARLSGLRRDELRRLGATLHKLAYDLRFADADKELLDGVITGLHELPTPTGTDAARRRGEDLKRLRQARRRARRARNVFVNANLRLVISVANSFKSCGVPFVDSIQEGNLGLLKAVDRFDHRRGFRFSTYAHWWIRHCIRRAMGNAHAQVRVPVHVAELKRRADDARFRLRQQFEREAEVTEIAEALAVPVAKLEFALSSPAVQTVSIHESVGLNDPRSQQEVIADASGTPVDETVDGRQLMAYLETYLHALPPVERDVLSRRYGLGDDRDETLDEVSRAHSLSRERVRQIQQQGLAKLRKMCKYDGLLG